MDNYRTPSCPERRLYGQFETVLCCRTQRMLATFSKLKGDIKAVPNTARILKEQSCRRPRSVFPASFNPNFSQLTPLPLCRPHLLMSADTFLFSRASQGLCEITYFTDPLSCATLPAHQTADLLTLPRPVILRTLVSVFWLFSLASRSKVKMHKEKNKRWVS